ncbi:MAG: DUF1801 domain-containing protein [Gammaproteobacteria bacterium]
MAENKTKETTQSVTAFLNSIEPAQKRKDAKAIAAIMRKASGERAKMWGASIVGYGRYHYKYDSGREGDSLRVGFSPRKQSTTVYIIPGFNGFSGLLKKLGKHKVTKSCLYINKLDDVNVEVLTEIIEKSLKIMSKKYPH